MPGSTTNTTLTVSGQEQQATEYLLYQRAKCIGLDHIQYDAWHGLATLVYHDGSVGTWGLGSWSICLGMLDSVGAYKHFTFHRILTVQGIVWSGTRRGLAGYRDVIRTRGDLTSSQPVGKLIKKIGA